MVKLEKPVFPRYNVLHDLARLVEEDNLRTSQRRFVQATQSVTVAVVPHAAPDGTGVR